MAPRESVAFRRTKKRRARNHAGSSEKNPGSVLLSHTASRAVPSAPKSLTSEFGMGSGVASSMSPPEILGRFPAGSFLVETSAGLRHFRCLANNSQPESRARAHCSRAPEDALKFDVCLRNMVKPHDLLVPVSSVDYSTSTPGLSTS